MAGLWGVKSLIFVIFMVYGFCWGLCVFVSNFALLFATGRAGCLSCAKTELNWQFGLVLASLVRRFLIGRFGGRTGLSKGRSLLSFLAALDLAEAAAIGRLLRSLCPSPSLLVTDFPAAERQEIRRF